MSSVADVGVANVRSPHHLSRPGNPQRAKVGGKRVSKVKFRFEPEVQLNQ